MQKVTLNQLASILLTRQTQPGLAVFANITQVTEVKMRKRGNPYAESGVTKITNLTVLLNTSYESGVRNQLEREGRDRDTYEAGRNSMPLEYGRNNTFIGTFKGEFVLQYRPFDNSRPRTKHLFEGRLFDKRNIAEFLPEERIHEAQDSRQGTDKEIMWRKVYLRNVRRFKIDGTTYKVVK